MAHPACRHPTDFNSPEAGLRGRQASISVDWLSAPLLCRRPSTPLQLPALVAGWGLCRKWLLSGSAGCLDPNWHATRIKLFCVCVILLCSDAHVADPGTLNIFGWMDEHGHWRGHTAECLHGLLVYPGLASGFYCSAAIQAGACLMRAYTPDQAGILGTAPPPCWLGMVVDLQSPPRMAGLPSSAADARRHPTRGDPIRPVGISTAGATACAATPLVFWFAWDRRFFALPGTRSMSRRALLRAHPATYGVSFRQIKAQMVRLGFPKDKGSTHLGLLDLSRLEGLLRCQAAFCSHQALAAFPLRPQGTQNPGCPTSHAGPGPWERLPGGHVSPRRCAHPQENSVWRAVLTRPRILASRTHGAPRSKEPETADC